MSKPGIAPKVSVAIPTYNYGRFLPETLDSVLGQTFGDFELIVSDNCSTDDTREIVENYARQDERIRYFRNESNVGMVANWNLCLTRSAGEYVKVLCADDLLEPTCLEKSVGAMEQHPGAALVCTARSLVECDLKPIGTLSYSDRFESREGHAVIQECLIKGNRIGEPSAVLFRREFARRGFLPAYKQLTDLEMWLHILEQGAFLAIPEPLCRFRQHEGQGTKANRRSLVFFDDGFLLYESYVRKPYVRCSFMEKQRFKFDLALHLWTVQNEGVDLDEIHEKMGRYYNPYLFHVLHFLFMVKKVYRSRSARHS